MSRQTAFLTIFIISIISLVAFLIFYFQGIGTLIGNIDAYEKHDPRPAEVFGTLFSPAVIISGVILGISSLLYRIMGIVYVAQNKEAQGGEKVLWIVGFIIFGFITAIVFLILGKSRKFL